MAGCVRMNDNILTIPIETHGMGFKDLLQNFEGQVIWFFMVIFIKCFLLIKNVFFNIILQLFETAETSPSQQKMC